jgi:hypothetical protein
MIELYQSAIHARRWIAYIQGEGWVMFPAREGGWDERTPARGIDPMHLRKAPLSAAREAGVPLAPARSPRKAA